MLEASFAPTILLATAVAAIGCGARTATNSNLYTSTDGAGNGFVEGGTGDDRYVGADGSSSGSSVTDATVAADSGSGTSIGVSGSSTGESSAPDATLEAGGSDAAPGVVDAADARSNSGCLYPFSSCTLDSQCCSGSCAGGTCTCRGPGSCMTNLECGNGNCGDCWCNLTVHKCTCGFCAQTGDPCANSGDCCGGRCTAADGALGVCR
jgi:hypothetical protein